MKLYHGSLEIVDKPRIMQPSRTLDYGFGFYTTSSYEQAEHWVKRKKGKNTVTGYVNEYEFEEHSLQSSELKVLQFKKPTSEWVDFVMLNRMNASYNHTYDLVYGPVANDKVYAAFALFENGFLNKEGLILELKAYKLVDQILFHTNHSLKHLRFTHSKEIHL